MKEKVGDIYILKVHISKKHKKYSGIPNNNAALRQNYNNEKISHLL